MPRACRCKRQARADVRQINQLGARFYRACRRVAQARSVVLVAHPPPAGARLPGVNGSMRPHDNDEDPGAEPRGRPTARLGVAPRCAGEAAARGRAAAHRGFTPALPPAGPARRALEEGGPQLGLPPGPVRTLCTLLGLYRGWGLRRPPVLAAPHAGIARAAGCDERTAQKHLALLRARGLVLVEYGPHNRRRPEPDAGPDDPAGIALRRALAAAAELRVLLDRLEKERRAAVAELRQAQRALLLARAALATQSEPDGPVMEQLDAHRRGLRRGRGGGQH